MNRFRYNVFSEIPRDRSTNARRSRPERIRTRASRGSPLFPSPLRWRGPPSSSRVRRWTVRVRRWCPRTPSPYSSGGAGDRPQGDRTTVFGGIRSALPARNVRVQAVRCAALPLGRQVRSPLRLAGLRPRDTGGRPTTPRRGWRARGDPVRPLRGPLGPCLRRRTAHPSEHAALRKLHFPEVPAEVGRVRQTRATAMAGAARAPSHGDARLPWDGLCPASPLRSCERSAADLPANRIPRRLLAS